MASETPIERRCGSIRCRRCRWRVPSYSAPGRRQMPKAGRRSKVRAAAVPGIRAGEFAAPLKRGVRPNRNRPAAGGIRHGESARGACQALLAPAVRLLFVVPGEPLRARSKPRERTTRNASAPSAARASTNCTRSGEASALTDPKSNTFTKSVRLPRAEMKALLG